MQEIDLVYEAIAYDGWCFPSIVVDIIYQKHGIELQLDVIVQHLSTLAMSGIVKTDRHFRIDPYNAMYRRRTPTEIVEWKTKTK